MSSVYTKIADLDLTREEKKSLRILFTNKPLIRTEAEKIIPTCKDNEEILDYLKELLKPESVVTVQQSLPSQDIEVVADSIVNEPPISSEFSPSQTVQQSLSSQNVEVSTDPVVNEPLIKRIRNDTHLPENASQLLRYYELWNKPYDDWPSLREFSEYLRDVKKACVHNSFKMEIRALQKLFKSDHPAQLRLIHLEGQLKNQQKSRKIRRGNATKVSTKQKLTEKRLEIAKSSVITNGYHRINDHYNHYHDASAKLLKRDLLVDDERTDIKKMKKSVEAQ
ncbi:7186_t:CDS:2 [Diversispora eburnea]|uniref:7186_t:CDS:1 n=1 Tax=Diversispora eburnea TaxID=1213867 RepID=A0A9N9D5R4_9GLOM|nr:7186_t:CDS:2 [Diversispora eburnea]